MTNAFYIAAIIAVFATVRVITGTHAVHALLYLVISLLAVAVIFLILGAPFAAALEMIVYAGAVMVLFVFVVMMLNPGPRSMIKEKQWLSPGIWAGPVILSTILLAELAWIIAGGEGHALATGLVPPKEVAAALFGPYLLAVEMASILLLAGLVAACHLARRHPGSEPNGADSKQSEGRAGQNGDGD
ncbi:MAG: NADH-quinone oxidoreductase subunit J [Syntrophus sp. SKADARSKE-3]|nr:NADH-quinone oxidoreductase subunit J [Syntrophus sp. SKADARSKE-3]